MRAKHGPVTFPGQSRWGGRNYVGGLDFVNIVYARYARARAAHAIGPLRPFGTESSRPSALSRVSLGDPWLGVFSCGRCPTRGRRRVVSSFLLGISSQACGSRWATRSRDAGGGVVDFFGRRAVLVFKRTVESLGQVASTWGGHVLTFKPAV